MGYLNTAIKLANRTPLMRNRRRKFRKQYPKLNTVANVAAKAYNIQHQVNLIKGMVNAEKHYSDIDVGGTPSNTGTIWLINQVAQGDEYNNRQGNSILHKYIKILWAATINASASNTFIRLMVVCDTANQGSAPAVTDILATAATFSQKNVDNQRRFVILKDKRFCLSSLSNSCRTGKMYIKTNFHCRYSSPNSTSVLQNALYFVLLSNEATNTPVVVAEARNAFYDN